MHEENEKPDRKVEMYDDVCVGSVGGACVCGVEGCGCVCGGGCGRRVRVCASASAAGGKALLLCLH